jgi:hypothetical protein
LYYYLVHFSKYTDVDVAFVMPSYTTLRRLSLALKITKPYQPHSVPKADTLARFLSESKEKYLNDVRTTPGRGGEWTVVMGNEAGGMCLIPKVLTTAIEPTL